MSRSRHQHTHSVTTGLNPGGRVPVGYSYLERSHSLVTPTRRNVPKGMSSPFSSSPSVSHASLRSSDSLPDIAAVTVQQDHLPPSTTTTMTNRKIGTASPVLTTLTRSESERISIAEVVTHLPSNPEFWLPSQVALYLTHVLGLTPKAIVVDVTAYVRNGRMGGKAFLRLRERDLTADGLNMKWRKLMIAAVQKLRKDCVRNAIWTKEYAEQWNEEHVHADGKAESPAFAKGTLKRLRDKKAVRDMITNFENISEGNLSLDGDESFVALGNGLHKRSSISSLHSASSQGSPRPQMAPIYGEGFVRERAASFSSLHEDESGQQDRRRSAFTRAQLEEWFGDLSEQEAEALADELDGHETHAIRHESRSASSSSLHSRSEGSDSGPLTPSVEFSGFDLTPIDVAVVSSIVESHSAEETPGTIIANRSPEPNAYVEPLHRDILIDNESDEYDGGAEAIFHAVPRPGSGNNGKSNPYRRSTYDMEEVEALGLEGNNTFKFDTARKIGLQTSSEIDIGAAQDSIRIRNRPSSNFRQLFSPSLEQGEEEGHQDRCGAGERGEEPSADIHHAASSSEQSASSLNDEVPPLPRSLGTYGRTALAAALHAQGVVTSSPGDSIGKRAEDESEWGVTFSRKASRKGTLARLDAHTFVAENKEDVKEDSAASRMSQLFNPAPLSESNLQKHDTVEDDGGRNADDTSDLPADKILLPLTTLEPDSDGNRSIRKTSMVLVDRKRFEALAKRMGMLEEQLAGLEALSLPPDSDLGSMAARRSVSDHPSLDRLFEEIKEKSTSQRQGNCSSSEASNKEFLSESTGTSWSLPMRFGMIPSYALGLAAGASFVLLSEVFGRARR